MLRFPYQSISLKHASPVLAGATSRLIPLVIGSVTGPARTVAIPLRIDSGADNTILP